MPTLTVQEAIQFSADLRLPGTMSKEKKKELVIWTMEQLDLLSIANKRIGSVGTGISQEDKKKVTIAVELVAQPGILFLDEPTTGLDAASAYDVMKLVRDIANKNKTSIICTIHQPSREVYYLFDKVLMLQEGGHMVYFGKLTKLNSYYENYGFGIMDPVKNPADWAIEAVNLSPRPPKDIWLQTSECQTVLNKLKQKISPPNLSPPVYNGNYAVPIPHQFYYLTVRGWKAFSRNFDCISARIVASTIMGLALGLLYFELENIEVQFKQTVLVSILYVSVVCATESAAQEIPLLISERAMLYREIDSKFYSIVPYYIGRVVSEFPIIAIQALLFSMCIWTMAYHDYKYDPENSATSAFFEYLVGMTVALSVTTTFAQMLGVCSPNESVGNVLYTSLCTGSRMFAGYLTKLASMNPLARLINGVDFFKYSFFFLAGTQLQDSQVTDFLGQKMPVYDTFLYDSLIPNDNVHNPWSYMIGSVVFWLFFHAVILITLKFKKWDKR